MSKKEGGKLRRYISFDFLITYEVRKTRKYFNHKVEKKSPSLMNVHILYALELKTSKKNPSVYMYVCLSIPSEYTITFEGVNESKVKFG